MISIRIRTIVSVSHLTAVAVTVALAGCSQTIGGPVTDTASIAAPQGPTLPNQKASAVRVALILPMNGYGEQAEIARGMKRAAELALFEADNPAVRLVPKDDGGTPQGAVLATETAVSEGADIVLGPLLSSSVTAAAPVAHRAGVPLLAFSNDPHAARPGVYLMSFLASEEVRRVVDYAASHGKRRFAALIPANAYGEATLMAFREAVTRAGGAIVATQTYAEGATDMLAATKGIGSAIAQARASGQPVDALFAPSTADAMTALGPMLAYAGIDTRDIKLLGTSAWDQLGATSDPHLQGAWYAAADPDAWLAFSQKYQKTYGAAPPRLASLAYDAMRIALELSPAPSPVRFAPDRITRPEGFVGVDGPVRFTPDGLSQRALAVLEVGEYKPLLVEPASQASGFKQISSADATQ